MSDLPKGWALAAVKEIASSVKGKKPKALSDIKTDGTVPYIDIRAFDKGEIRQYADILSSNIASKKDVLVVWDGARSGLVGIGQEGAIGSTLAAIRPFEIMPEYLFRFLQTQYAHINSNPRGTGIPHVDPEVFWNIDFPIAPITEQRRIVAKLERLLHKIDASKERLDKIPAILKRFRQAVLVAACSGRLTADWRKKNDLPEWKGTTIREIATSMSTGPFGSMLHSYDYIENGIPVINPTNIVADKIIPDNTVSLGQKKADEMARYRLQKNDILLARRGDLSKCGIVTEKEVNWIAGTGLFILRANINPIYFKYLFSTDAIQKILNAKSIGSTMLNLNQTILGDIELFLPTLSEQHEIVCRVEALFKKADDIEARYKKAKGFVDGLTQSILAKAFRGELVPQDPYDEPASALLAHIRKARQEESNEIKPKKYKKGRQ